MPDTQANFKAEPWVVQSQSGDRRTMLSGLVAHMDQDLVLAERLSVGIKGGR